MFFIGMNPTVFCDICSMNIVLMGYMGSGKTAVGRRLAALLQREFIDLDALIEQRLESTISEIFEQKGVVYFRKYESEILREICGRQGNAVIALGGGTPIYGDNLKWINDSDFNLSIYLKISIQPLVKRLWPKRHHRPIIASLSTPEALEEFVRKHLFERTFAYMQAQLVVDVSDLNVDSVANEILNAVQNRIGDY
jgi:shikimate kinase